MTYTKWNLPSKIWPCTFSFENVSKLSVTRFILLCKKKIKKKNNSNKKLRQIYESNNSSQDIGNKQWRLMISEWTLGLPSLLSEEFPVRWQREKSCGDEFGSPGKLTRLEFSDREQEERTAQRTENYWESLSNFQ